MPGHDEHPSKASAWHEGRFVLLPDAADADMTVWFGCETSAPGDVSWEGLLAIQTTRDTARLCAVPFWLYDVNLGDEVRFVESAEGAPVAEVVVADSGNFTFRVVFAGADSDDPRWSELMVELEPYDCWFDIRAPGYVAVSSPSEHAQTVAEYLTKRESAQELQYETGRSTPLGS